MLEWDPIYDLACDILFSLINSKTTHHVVPCNSYDCFSCDGSFTVPKLHFVKKIEFSVVSVSWKSKFVHVRFVPLLVHCCSDKEKETGLHFLSLLLRTC